MLLWDEFVEFSTDKDLADPYDWGCRRNREYLGASIDLYIKDFNYEFNPKAGWWNDILSESRKLPKTRGLPVWCKFAEWPLEDYEQLYIKACRK
jgi:hypothetical protein